MAVGQKDDGRWYVAGRKGYWPDEPNRTREYFGRGAVAEARARARDMELGGRRSLRPAPEGPRFAEIAKDYLAAKNFREKSRKELEIRLTAIILPSIGNHVASSITPEDVDQFVESRRRHMTKKGTFVRGSTIRREVTDIKSILSWAADKKRRPPLIPIHPLAGYELPEADDDVIIPPTPEEAEAIYQAAVPHLRRAIILSWYLGLRPGAVELLSLTWVDVSEAAGLIRVTSAHKGGARFRDVPIHAGLQVHLDAWKKEDVGKGPLIRYGRRAILKIQTSWENALQRAGIRRRLRPYDLRHAFITRALSEGADIGAVSNLVGSSPETIRRHYQYVSRAMERRTVGMIAALDVVPSVPRTKGKKKK